MDINEYKLYFTGDATGAVAAAERFAAATQTAEKASTSLSGALLNTQKALDTQVFGTREAGAAWDVINGKWKFADATLKNLYVAQAGQIDALEKQSLATKEAALNADLYAKTLNSMDVAYARAIGGSKASVLQIQLEGKAYEGLTTVQKANIVARQEITDAVVASAAKEAEAVKASMTAQKAAMAEVEAAQRRRQTLVNAAPSKLKSVGGAMTMGVTLPYAIAMGSMAEVAANYERSQQVFQAANDVSAQEMEKVRAKAVELGRDFNLPATSAKGATESMLTLTRAGMSVDGSMQAVRASMLLAAATGNDQSESAKIMARTLNSYSEDATHSAQVTDMLTNATLKSGASLQELAGGIAQAGSMFQSAHLPMDMLITDLALLTHNGLSGEEAGTALKQMLIKLENPSTKAKEVMHDLGISIFDASGHMKPLNQFMGELGHSLDGASDKERTFALANLGGARAVRALNILLQQGSEGYDKMREAVDKTGTAQAIADAQMSGLIGAQKRLGTALTDFATEKGPRYLDMETKIVDGFAGWIRGATGTNDATADLVVTVGGIAAAFGPAAIAVGTLWTQIKNMQAMSELANGSLGRTATVEAGVGTAAVGASPEINTMTASLTDMNLALDGTLAKGGAVATTLGKITSLAGSIAGVLFVNKIVHDTLDKPNYPDTDDKSNPYSQASFENMADFGRNDFKSLGAPYNDQIFDQDYIRKNFSTNVMGKDVFDSTDWDTYTRWYQAAMADAQKQVTDAAPGEGFNWSKMSIAYQKEHYAQLNKTAAYATGGMDPEDYARAGGGTLKGWNTTPDKPYSHGTVYEMQNGKFAKLDADINGDSKSAAAKAIMTIADGIKTPEGQASCAYFATQVLEQMGKNIPEMGGAKQTADYLLSHGGHKENVAMAKPGDLIVWTGPGYGAPGAKGANGFGTHVGIGLGGGMEVDSSDGVTHGPRPIFDKAHAYAISTGGQLKPDAEVRATQKAIDQIHAYEIEVRALRDGKLSLKDIEIQRANALMAEKAAEDGVSVATERRLISIKTETERLIENQRAKEKAIGATGFGIGSFAGDAVKSNAELDRFHTVVSDHLDSVNSKAPLAIQSVSDLTAHWLKLSAAEVDAFNKLSANDPLKMEAESAYMAKLATDNATKAIKDHADSVAYAVKQVREMQAAGNEQAKTFRDLDARYKSQKELSPVQASKAAAQREIDDHPLWTQAQKDTILADAAAKPGLDEYNRLLKEQTDLFDSLTLSAKAAADAKMRESGMSDAQIAEIDRLKTINDLYTQRKEISDQIASSLVGGLMDLTKKTPRDPQLYTARIGYDNALSNLDTAYAGGLHNSDTASAFAHDRKMIQDHLKQVEDAYKGNANTIANSVEKVFADLAHSALEDVSKKLQKNLSDSISKMILGAFMPHAAKNGGSQAGFSIGAAMSAIPGFPGMGPGSKQETSVFNAQVLNVASMNGGIGGGAGGGGGLFGSLLGAAIGGATKGGGEGLAIGKSFQALPFHASGGDVFAGQPFIAGDPGPNSELIMPRTGGHVFTAAETRAILAKGSSGDGSNQQVHVHIHGEEAVSAFQRNPNVTLKRAVKAAMSHLQSTGGR